MFQKIIPLLLIAICTILVSCGSVSRDRGRLLSSVEAFRTSSDDIIINCDGILANNVRNRRNLSLVINYSNQREFQGICHFNRNKLDVYTIPTRRSEIALFYSFDYNENTYWAVWDPILELPTSLTRIQFRNQDMTIEIFILKSQDGPALERIRNSSAQGPINDMLPLYAANTDGVIFDFSGGRR